MARASVTLDERPRSRKLPRFVMQPALSGYLKGAAFGFAAVSIWASWSVVTRLVVTTSLDASDIVALRFGVAGVLLSPVIVQRGLARDQLGWLGLAVIIAGTGALCTGGGGRAALCTRL
jgi:drug/metabolite transporter (DMT)-like permease